MPTGQSMLSSLKSNKSIALDKSKRFKKTLGGYGKNRKPEYDFPKAKPELLEQIRLKAKKDYKRKQLLYSAFFLILFSVVIYTVYF
jgi:hypothetical protein|nr:hypothetical protein [uncultured Psychroserpens sp.]